MALSTEAKSKTSASLAPVVTLKSKNGLLKARIDLNGGMLSELCFDESFIQNEAHSWRSVLHKAPWLKDDHESNAPGIDNHLSGEWACVPFGFVTYDHEVFVKDAPHGLPCHSKMQVVSVPVCNATNIQGVSSTDADAITLRFTYPDNLPLSTLERTIRLKDESKEELLVEFSFTVVAKEDCKVPLGAHPCFPLYDTKTPLSAQALDKTVVDLNGKFDFGMVYPQECEKGVSRLLPQSTFLDLKKVKLLPDYCNQNGNTDECNLSSLPLPYKTEEIVQLLGISSIELSYNKLGYSVALKWDNSIVKSALLWISNEGRSYEPWCDQNRCLGIEPIASAWDMGDISTKDNPIASAGYPTYVSLTKNTPFTFTYELSIKKL